MDKSVDNLSQKTLARIFVVFLLNFVLGESLIPFLSQSKKAFGGTFHQTFLTTKKKLQATSMQTEQEMATQSSNPDSQWKVIPANAKDYQTHLSERPLWSETQFQDSLALYEQLTSCTDSYVAPGIKMALNTLDHAYRLYGPQSVICSFNGGKDAVVILHLVRAAHAKFYNDTLQRLENNKDHDNSFSPASSVPIIRPRVVYFNHPDEFPEVVDFLHESVKDYDLDMIAFEEGIQFAQGLGILVTHNILPGCNTTFPMAFVLGTRSSDPNAVGQDHFAPSSHWMPPFMRVNPILEWNYGHVWHFLRLFQLPYCCLYDAGYTSLGTTKDTLPCPALAVTRGSVDGDNDNVRGGFPKFWPAYMLRDWDQERAGRIKKEKKLDKKKKSSESLPVDEVPSSVSAMSIGAQLEARSIVLDASTIESASQSYDNINNTTESVVGDAGLDDSSMFSMGGEGDAVNGITKKQKTVGILIIGDEILKGLTIDKNTNVAAKALRKQCVMLRRVVVVSDDQDEIVKDIRRLQNEVDVIITSGGVGPTHDDVTIKSVAASLDRPMLFHEEMAELLKSKMNQGVDDPLTPSQVKMATLPSNAKLRYLSDDEDDWPVLQCRNIFILPGVPEFFAKKIENVAAYLSSQLERSAAYKVVLKVDEAAIVDVLNEAVKNHPNVTFGSYPFVSHPEYKTVVTLEGSLMENQTISVVSGNSDSGVNEDITYLQLRNSTMVIDPKSSTMIPKDRRDQYVRVALDDLIKKLPKDSILRVENDDLTPFT